MDCKVLLVIAEVDGGWLEIEVVLVAWEVLEPIVGVVGVVVAGVVVVAAAGGEVVTDGVVTGLVVVPGADTVGRD